MKKFTLFSILNLIWFFITVSFAQTRTESDLLGEIQVPADAYYGPQAARAMDNFQISGQYINEYPDYIKAWGMIKLAAAQANNDAGAMSTDKLKLIEPACQELIAGKYIEQFGIDLYQGGAGTSTNMNANEVLANIALVKAGHNKGEYDIISPNDDLNMSQSTNDTYPTSLKLTMLMHNKELVKELSLLATSFRVLGNKYIDVIKWGVPSCRMQFL